MEDPRTYCFMIRKGRQCIKTKVAEIHLPFYECEKCIWRIQSEDHRYLASLEKIYQKYGDKIWNV